MSGDFMSLQPFPLLILECSCYSNISEQITPHINLMIESFERIRKTFIYSKKKYSFHTVKLCFFNIRGRWNSVGFVCE